MSIPNQRQAAVATGEPHWRLMTRPAAEGLLRTLRIGRAGAESIAWSPDGATLLAAAGASLRVFDAASGEERAPWIQEQPLPRTLENAPMPQSKVVWSRDGATVASAGAGSAALLWNPATGAPRATLTGHAQHIMALAFDPAGGLLASASFDGGVKVWDVAAGSELASAQASAEPVMTLAFSPDGATLVSGGSDGRLICWEPRTLAQRSSLIASPGPGAYNDPVDACAFSRDGSALFTLARNGVVTQWDVAGWQSRSKIDTRTVSASAFALSPDGAVIALSAGQRLLLFDATTGAPLASLAGHAARIAGCAFSPDGVVLASCAADGAVRLWDAHARETADAPLPAHPSSVRHCVYSPDGAVIATASLGESTLRLWDGATGDLRGVLDSSGYGAVALAWSPDSKTVLSAGSDKTLALWDVATQTQRATLTGHTNALTGCGFSPDGLGIASTSMDGSLRLWDAATGDPHATCLGHSDGVVGHAFSPDGALIATSGPPTDRSIILWDAHTGKQRRAMEDARGEVVALAWSPDGATLAAAHGYGAVTFWDPQTGAQLAILSATQRLSACAYSPDGATLLALGIAGAIFLWDMETGAQYDSVNLHASDTPAYAWLPDGALATACDDKTLRLWDGGVTRQLAETTLSEAPSRLACHPAQPLLAVGDATGDVYLAAMEDYSAGPTIVTAGASADGERLVARCLACGAALTVTPEQLGQELLCPAEGCGARLRLNRFAVPPLPARGLAAPAAQERHALLDALSQAIAQEANVLGERPGLLFQQVFNRLQWSGEPEKRLIDVERARRSTEGASPWVRNASPPNEAPGLIRTLVSASASAGLGNARCAFSPDGASLLSGGNGGALLLWDVATGRERLTLHGASGFFRFSPDGHAIVSAGRDGLLMLLDTATGAERARLAGHTDSVVSAAYSPDGATLGSVSRDGTLRLWDARSGSARHVLLTEEPDYVRQRADMVGNSTNTRLIAFSPDGASVMAAGLTSTVHGAELFNFLRVYDVASGATLGDVTWERDTQGRGVQFAGFSRDGATVYAQAQGEQPFAWDTRDWRPCAVDIAEAKHALYAPNFSPDGQLFVQFRRNGKLEVIEEHTGDLRALIYGHSMGIESFAWSPDSALLATAGGEGTTKLWRIPATTVRGARPAWLTRNEDPALAGHSDTVWASAWSPDGATLATGSKDKTVKLWNPEIHQPKTTLQESDDVYECAYSPDGALLALRLKSKEARVWRPQSDAPVAALAALTRKMRDVAALAWRPVGAMLATAHDSGALMLWDLATFNARTPEPTPLRATLHAPAGMSLSDLRWSADGRMLAAYAQPTVFVAQRYWLVWDAQTGALRYTLPAERDNADLSFNPDGATVVTRIDALSLGVWDAQTGAERGRLAYWNPAIGDPGGTPAYGNPYHISFAGWSVDGDTIYTTGRQGRAQWDAHTLERRSSSATLDDLAWDERAATTPDGRTQLVVSFQRRTLTLRDAASGSLLATALFPFGQREIATHPWLPRLATADQLGNVSFLDLEDFEYGPLLVTTRDAGDGPAARCPVCRQTFAVSAAQPGAEITCPHADCGARLRLSPFVLQTAEEVFQGESAPPTDFAFSPLPAPTAPPATSATPAAPETPTSANAPALRDEAGATPTAPRVAAQTAAPNAPSAAPAAPVAPPAVAPRPPAPPLGYPYPQQPRAPGYAPHQAQPQRHPIPPQPPYPPYPQRPPAGVPYPPPGYPPAGYPPASYPPASYPPASYPPAGYPPVGYPRGYAPPRYPAQRPPVALPRAKKRPWWMFWRRG
jgi:WD40 repeat protein